MFFDFFSVKRPPLRGRSGVRTSLEFSAGTDQGKKAKMGCNKGRTVQKA
jgi:hypothetical protein